MASKLPKPTSLRLPQSRPFRPLQSVPENRVAISQEAPATLTRVEATAPPLGLRRRSKSVTDLRSLRAENVQSTFRRPINIKPPQSKPKPPTAQKSTGTVPKTATKRPATKNKDDDQPKAKVTRKIPDWDFKTRFHVLNEKHLTMKENMQGLTARLEGLSSVESDLLRAQERIKELEETKEKLNKLETEHEELKQNYLKTEESLSHLKEIHEELTNQNAILQEKYNKYVSEHKDLLNKYIDGQENIKEMTKTIESLKNTLRQYQIERRKLHNNIQDLKGNIRVFCRIRPPINNEEEQRLQCSIDLIEDNGLEIRKSKESISQITGKVQDTKLEFTFDKVFGPNTMQAEIFEELSQLVQSALDGYDVCVFAYGQTGSGKTHTMQGDEASPGMIPRTVDLIFESVAMLRQQGWQYNVRVSFLEVYNENIRDLLVPLENQQRLEVQFNNAVTTVSGLTVADTADAHQMGELMRRAHRHRATAATNFNEHSSRSHAVTKIELVGELGPNVYRGSISLVDLAGSESAKHSVKGDRLTETKNINKSLATLGDVISALYNKSGYVPYRNSKLTSLLRSCLGGNSKTLMVVNVAPFEDCYHETINTLRFAAKVKEVKTVSKRNKTTIS